MENMSLALSSGGWRGLAHIGVIKSLLKNGVRISRISGSSMGALIGGLYAATEDIDKVEQIMSDIRYRDLFKALGDPGLRSGNISIKGNDFVKFIKKSVGDIMVEDLNIGFSAIATDIMAGKGVSISKGSLAEAIRASASIPFIFSPVIKDGLVLMDGGLVDPLPVDTLRSNGPDRIIAVNVYGSVFPADYNKRLGGIRVAGLCRFGMLNKMAEISMEKADIRIRPEIKDAGKGLLLRMIGGKDVIDAGESAADKELEHFLNKKSL